MASAAPQWRFGRMQPWEINQNPVQGEFFTSTADLPERLVREALQNSLDARRRNETVRVRFTFSDEENALPDAKRYLDGLEPHIQADPDADVSEREAIADARACLNRPMTWLAIEDSGTTGLTGDIRANDPREADNDFWGFFRSIGISPKSEDAGGSWGLGKWVFPDASMINAYLGATRRADEDRVLLMGMAVLRTHSIEGVKHPPYGQFAVADDSADEQWLPLPLDSDVDADFVLQALTDFGLERLEEPGLSVVVPYPKEDLTPRAIARAVLTQYFFPIVRGDLSVEIAAPGERRRAISADTIIQELIDIPPSDGENTRDEETPESLVGAIRLAQWATGLEDTDYIKIPVPSRTNDTLERLDLDELREQYERDERLAFELSVGVQRRGSSERTQTSFRAYIERAEELTTGHDYFIRGHLSMSRMDHIQRFNARALVVVDGRSELAHLLRDSEGPAHISWDWYEQRLKDHWVGGQGRVDEVRRSAVRLLQRLAERPDEQQFALADLFPADPAAIRKGARSGRRGNTSGPPLPPPPPSAAALTVTATTSGFSVRGPLDSGLRDSEWSLRFAYDVVRGDNPFKLFDSGLRQGAPDFELGTGEVAFEAHSAEAKQEAANALRFRILDDDFRLDVRGLDNRDVLVELRRHEPDDSTDDVTMAI